MKGVEMRYHGKKISGLLTGVLVCAAPSSFAQVTGVDFSGMTWPAINIDLSGTTITNSITLTGPSASLQTGDTTVGAGNGFTFSPSASMTWPFLTFTGTVTPLSGSSSATPSAAPASATVSAGSYSASSTVDATNGTGLISLYGPTININTLPILAAATNIGNTNEGSTISLQAGNSGASFANNQAYFGVTNGGGFQADATSASMGVANGGGFHADASTASMGVGSNGFLSY
ncbi:MAG: hypothetical protein HGA47_05905, partial [Zoogloea sp.]|nr:hypothetical protein [Zoogloea sp.]